MALLPWTQRICHQSRPLQDCLVWVAKSWETVFSVTGNLAFPHSDRPTLSGTTSRARHMHREQNEHTIDGAEPMRRVFRNENEISFCDGARRSTFNRRATEVRGICSSLLDELATRHQSRRSIDHVENLCLLFMDGGVAD